MTEIRNFDAFNERRYSDPWVAAVDKNGRLDFKNHVGGYTGRRGAGEAGTLYLNDEPKEGDLFAYGQKDYRGNNTFVFYIQWRDGKKTPVEKDELVEAVRYRASLVQAIDPKDAEIARLRKRIEELESELDKYRN